MIQWLCDKSEMILLLCDKSERNKMILLLCDKSKRNKMILWLSDIRDETCGYSSATNDQEKDREKTSSFIEHTVNK